MAERTQQVKEQRVAQYEAMFLVGTAAAAEQGGGVELCRGVVEKHAGQILFIKKWDERKLAYEVKGQKRGTYVIAYFNAPGGAVAQIERDVRLSDDLLRVMVTTADHLNQQEMEAVEPQPIQRVEERAPWDRPSWNDRPPREDRGPRDDRGPRGPRREEAPAPAADAAAKE